MQPETTRERGAAEMVGVLMLISIFVVVIAVIAIGLFLSSPPDKNPAVNLQITNESKLVKLYHAGGDSLQQDKIQIYVDGTLRTAQFMGFDPDNTWSAGEVLSYTADTMPSKVDVVYTESPKHGTNAALITSVLLGDKTSVQPDVTVFIISASAGSGGTITPTGSVKVNAGNSQTFTIAPNAGYSLLDVAVDGALQGPISSYPFTNVGSDHSISATFKAVVIPAPVANFTGNPISGTAPLAVQFTDTSTGTPTAWIWTFGDIGSGNTSTYGSPLHTYTTPGIYSVNLTVSNAGGSNTLIRTNYITVISPLAANFTGTPTSGSKPLLVSFTDKSTGTPTGWNWAFGDGSTSTVQNPQHTYADKGNYTVNLTVTKGLSSSTVSKVNYIQVMKKSFIDFVISENVFVYGNKLIFAGNDVTGPDATIAITGPITTNDLNGGASIAVKTIYIGGDVTLDGGSAGLGSPSNPGAIYVNGNLYLGSGQRDIYGNVYVSQNFYLKNATNFNHPEIVTKCIQVATVPTVTMPDSDMPPVKSADWYAARGYVSGGALTSNMKIFASSYAAPSSSSSVATNVVIVASNGDITLTGFGGGGVTGVFFAPNGKVTFQGGSFEGVVIARDGFYVSSGGTHVTFKNLVNYISNPDDYPF